MAGPFEQHMLDAIALNAERAPRYAALSGGASLAISRRLILAERAFLPAARWFDRRATPWRRAGIPMLEEILVAMEGAPAFAPSGPPIIAAASGPPPAAVRQRVLARYRQGGFEAAAAALEIEIASLAAEPGADCLARHLLESAHRLTMLAPGYLRLADERGLASPRWLLALLLRLHLWGLGAASDLDARARPLQARGIPILARDLPPISVAPSPSTISAVNERVLEQP